MYMLELYQNPS